MRCALRRARERCLQIFKANVWIASGGTRVLKRSNSNLVSRQMNTVHQSDDILKLTTNGTSLGVFLNPDLARIRSIENRQFALGLLAGILLAGGLPEFNELQSMSGISPSELLARAAEVEPKIYQPGQTLTEVSEVLRALARVLNAMRSGESEEASEITHRISWPFFRQIALAGILANLIRHGDVELGEGITAEIRAAASSMASSGQLVGEPAHDNESLRMAVELAVAAIIPPGSKFAFSRRPIKVTVTRVDAVRGEVSLNIGACRYIEGSQFAPFLEAELKARIPQLRNVSVGMYEV